MTSTIDINNLTENLVSFAYPELEKKELVVTWGKSSVFAQVHWSDDDSKIGIKINQTVKDWHQAGITGLLSHELSHPAQSGSGLKELETDLDTISRGLGSYLAVERLFAGKYEDHIISRGKDRYLGYRSIRTRLTTLEIQNLDILMSKLQLKPIPSTKHTLLTHDYVLLKNKRRTIISIDGNQFEIPDEIINPDIKMVFKKGKVSVYVDEILVGQYEDDTFL